MINKTPFDWYYIALEPDGLGNQTWTVYYDVLPTCRKIMFVGQSGNAQTRT